MSEMTSLNVFGNQLKALPGIFSGFLMLRVLVLDDNQLTEPAYFPGFHRLEALRLQATS